MMDNHTQDLINLELSGKMQEAARVVAKVMGLDETLEHRRAVMREHPTLVAAVFAVQVKP